MDVIRMLRGAMYLILSISIIACSGGDDGIDGSGLNVEGTAAVGTPISNAAVVAKTENGTKVSQTTSSTGKFNFTLDGAQGPVLLRVDSGNGTFLFSIATSAGTTNIHPITDLIIRNWFKVQGLDVETEFESNGAASQLPSVTEIEDIELAIRNIINLTLLQFTLPTNQNLISTPFDADSTGFDLYLDHTQVAIINNQITLVVKDQATDIENEMISGNVAISYDFTSADNDAPNAAPANVRAVPASSSEIIVVWDPSTDNVGVAGYNIYRDNVLVDTTPYPVFSDSGLSTGLDYCYEVEAFDSASNTTARSTEACVQTLAAADITAPPAPTTVSAIENGSSSIDLSWNQTQINDVVGFNVYRGATGSVSTLVATVTATFYSDFGLLSNNQYCYKVEAYDAAGNTSAMSTPEACATTDVGVQTQPSGSSSVEFSSATYLVSESDGALSVTVNRNGDASEAISVDYSFTDGSATGGQDYVATNGTLNWLANDSSPKTIFLQINGDMTSEGEETVNLVLSNASQNVSIGANGNALVTISDVACAGILDTNITVNTTITDACTLVTRDVSISNAATLTISPGVTLIFQSGTSINVRTDGALTAAGTAAMPILMTGEQPTPGYWQGIQFTFSNNINNVLDYVTIEYGGGAGGNGSANVVMYGATATPQRLKMSNTVLRESLVYGFEFNDGSILDTFSNVTSTANTENPGRLPANLVGVLDGNSDYSGNTIDEMLVVTGSVDDDQTWSAINVPYSTGSHSINANLTIEAGATLIFRSGGDLNVRSAGSLSAVGTVAQPILFTGDQPTPGYWQGIQYTFSNNINNELDYVTVEYGGGSGGNGSANVVMYGATASPQRLKMSNTILRESLVYGFEFNDGSILDTFSNVTSTANTENPGSLPANLVGILDGNSDYSGNSIDEMLVLSGSVDNDQTWPTINVPYSTGGHSINADLVVEAGVTLIFRAGGNLNVRSAGSLSAIGTATSRITMTAEVASPGYWDGVQFTFSNNINNVFDYVTVEYGGTTINGEGNVILYGASTNQSSLNITNSMLQNSLTYGLWLDVDSIINSDYATSNSFSGNTVDDIFQQ